MEPNKPLHYMGRFQALPSNIILGLEWIIVTNALVYITVVLTTDFKRFIVQAQDERAERLS
jgi:hypothetical protein